MIRQFRTEDAEACTELIQACIWLDADYPAELKQLLTRTESPSLMCRRAALFYVAVCEVDANVVGIGAVEMNEIRLLYVSPEHQRRGIGRDLLHHLEEMVPSGLFTDVFLYSNLNAVRFYKAQGYREHGRHTFRLGDQSLPTMFMSKIIRR